MFASAPLATAHEASPPVPVHQPSAPWPGEPSAHDVVVPVRLVVGPDGSVEEAEVEASVSPELDAAAIETAQSWRFQPAIGEDGPMRAKIRAVVRFIAPAAPSHPEEEHAHAHGAEPPHIHPHGHDAEPSGEDEHAHAHAAQADPAQPIQVEGHGTDEHEAVVVRGSKRARAPSEARIERDILSAAPASTGSDLLRRVPGVFITQHSGEGKAHQIFFRGFDAVHGQDLEILAGGIPVNDVSNVHGQGYADLHFLPPEVVSRVDALPGAFDPAQGDFAIAGSLRYQLGFDRPGITAKGTLGSFDSRRLFLAYRPPGQPEETFAAVEVYETEGFGMHRAASRASAVAQAWVPLSDAVAARVLASAYAGRFDSAGVLRLSDIQSGRVERFDSYDPDQGGSSGRMQLGVELVFDHESWQGSLFPFVVRRNLRLQTNYTGFLDDAVAGDNSIQENDATTLGLSASLTKRMTIFTEHDSATAGVYFRHDVIDQVHEQAAGPAEYVRADIGATNIAGYAELNVRPISRVLVRAGGRVDGLAYVVDDQLADARRSAEGFVFGPRSSVDVAILAELHALAGYSLGFRSPQARSLGDGEETPFTRAHSFELGLRYGRDRNLRASVAGFATMLEDDLVFNEATSRNEPAPSTLRMGTALHLEARRGDWFTGALGASYTRATFSASNERFVEGDLVPFVPQVVVRSDVGVHPQIATVWQRPLRLEVGSGMGGIFRRPLPFGEIGTDVFLVDAMVGASLPEVELQFAVENLLDLAWNDGEFVYVSDFSPGTGSSLVPARHVTAGSPRRFSVSLRGTY